MIHSITLNLLRNSEYIQFLNDVVDVITVNDVVKQKVDGKLNILIGKKKVLEGLFKTSTASPLTKDIEQIDLERDAAITGLNQTILGFTYHYKPELKNAALLLNENLNLYGSGIAGQNYQAETSILKNIVEDWENKPELKQALVTLNLADWKEYLKERNTLFNQKYLERTKEYAEISPEKIKPLREEANQDYYNLRDLIVSYATILENDPDFAQVIDQINTLVEQYNLLLTKRAPSEEDKKTSKDA